MSKSSAGESLDIVARLLDLVPFLSSHQGISIEDLAKEFRVSSSQMTQDLNTLWMCGLPGYTPYELIDLSFDTGFVTISNAETLQHPRSLSRDEVLALLLGLETLGEELKNQSSAVVDIIDSLLGRLRNLVDSRVVAQVQAGDSTSGVLLGTLKEAISNRASLKIEYHSITRDEISERHIVPLEIVVEGKIDYLYAYCNLSSGYRTFRVDRILKTYEDASTITTYKAISSPKDDASIRVRVMASSRQRDVAERFRPESMLPSISDQEVSFQCFSQEWAVREIMSFGGVVRAISPEPIKAAILERSLRTLKAYSKDL